MTTTIGSLDLNAFSDLYSDSTQYFWFESNASATYGAGAHVTLVPDTSFISNPTGQNILINTDGFSVRNGLLPMMTLDNDSLDFNIVDTTAGTYTTTATFTATGAQIGQSGAAHSVIDADGQRFYAINGTTQLANIGYGEGAAASGTSIAPYYTFGTRASGSIVGNYSMSEGFNTTARGYASHAEGSHTTANGTGSHAEGFNTTVNASISHAEGSYTIASGSVSHAEGSYTTASGAYSHAQNYYTIAQRKSQTTIGEYNIADTGGTDGTTRGNYAFIVGNGTSNTARSNALTVDWDGNVNAAGSIISDANYEDAWNDSTQGYTVSGVSLAGSTYLGQAIRLEKVSATKKHPIFNGFDISGTGTARIHTLAHYIYKATYNGEQYWYAYIKMRNDNTSAINNFDVTAYIAWI